MTTIYKKKTHDQGIFCGQSCNIQSLSKIAEAEKVAMVDATTAPPEAATATHLIADRCKQVVLATTVTRRVCGGQRH